MSIWLTPPFMKSWITRRTLAAMMQPAVQVGAGRRRPGVALGAGEQAVPAQQLGQGDPAQAAAQPPEKLDVAGSGSSWRAPRSIQLTNRNSLLLMISRQKFASPWRRRRPRAARSPRRVGGRP